MHDSIVKHSIVRKAIDDRLHAIVQHLKHTVKHTIMSTEATDGALHLQFVTNPAINTMFIQKCSEHSPVRVEIFSTSIAAYVDNDPMLSWLVLGISVAD